MPNTNVEDEELRKVIFDFSKHIALKQMYANRGIRDFYQIDECMMQLTSTKDKS